MNTAFVLTSILYFFFVNSIYIVLLFLAVLALFRQRQLRPIATHVKGPLSVFSPSISILAPAYNEQETIVHSVKSFLLLNYPSFEIVVINDGSKDLTIPRLIEAFQMKEEVLDFDTSLTHAPVKKTYRSKLHPNLIVIDKENGGKADALNCGIQYAQHGLFCCVDSDSILESDALTKIAVPFFEDAKTVASGGTIRIANGANVKFGRVESVDLPLNFLVLMQIVEYTRAFLCGRIGWNMLNSTLVISGAFGLFSRSAVTAVGGYTKGSVGEDMELIVSIHKYYRDRNIPYRVVFVADPVCWTEAPTDAKSLGKQRDRWQRGLAESLSRNKSMMFNPKYGALGMIALPYFLLVEFLGPFVEVISWVYIVLAAVTGNLEMKTFLLFLTASLLYGIIMSIVAILIEEIFFSKYGSVKQFLMLFALSFFECFGYRQLNIWWRIKGIYSYVVGDKSWGHLERAGFAKKVKRV